MGMTPHFLVTGSSRGNIVYTMLEDQSVVNEFRHDDAGITRVFPQPEGTRLVFEDETKAVLLYNPVNDQVSQGHQLVFHATFTRTRPQHHYPRGRNGSSLRVLSASRVHYPGPSDSRLQQCP